LSPPHIGLSPSRGADRMAAGSVEVQVMGMAGQAVAAPRLSATWTVRDLKQHLCHAHKVPLFNQQLMIGTCVAEDSDVLSSLPQPLSFTLVVSAFNTEGGPPLLKSACCGRLEDVQQVLCARANPNFVDDDGRTPLFQAAHAGHAEIVRCLLEAGAERDTATRAGATPLHAAAQTGHVDVVRLLCEAGADKDLPAPGDGATPLFAAAQGGHLQVVRLLCGAQAEINRCRQHGATPLLIAALYDREEVVRFLCERGADRGRRLQDGTSALHAAALNGNAELARFLGAGAGAAPASPQRAAGTFGRVMGRFKCPHRQGRFDGMRFELDP